MLAIADTCLLIDWASYRKRDILSKIFTSIFVPEQVLDEVKSESILAWITENFARGTLILFTPTPDIVQEAQNLVKIVAQIPWARKIELPEAICLATGRLYGYTVLTENRGALMVKEILPEYHTVRIYRSIDILREAMLKRIINVSTREEILAELEIFNKDTGHIFRDRDIEELVKKVMANVPRRNQEKMGKNRGGRRTNKIKNG